MVPSRPKKKSQTRHGFTLIEILAVIIVIAVLVSLLLPAINSARSAVRRTAVRSEISQLEGAIAAFKNRFGIEPPSSMLLWEDTTIAGSWNNSPSANSLASLAIMRQIWPEFDPSANSGKFDWNGDGSFDTGSSGILITQGECLVFFLGGIPSNGSGFAPRGFSKNPVNPAVVGGTREGPFFEFDPKRLGDVSSPPNGFPEYKDSYPSQRLPYLYFSSYEGSGYREGTFTVTDYSTTYTGAPILAYRQGALLSADPYKSKSFQIISPGADSQYGPGGPYAPGSATPLPGYIANSTNIPGWLPTAITITDSDRDVEKDNITNFASGTLAQ